MTDQEMWEHTAVVEKQDMDEQGVQNAIRAEQSGNIYQNYKVTLTWTM